MKYHRQTNTRLERHLQHEAQREGKVEHLEIERELVVHGVVVHRQHHRVEHDQQRDRILKTVRAAVGAARTGERSVTISMYCSSACCRHIVHMGSICSDCFLRVIPPRETSVLSEFMLL